MASSGGQARSSPLTMLGCAKIVSLYRITRQNLVHTGMGKLAKNAKDTSTLGNLDKYFSREEENFRRLLTLQIALFEVFHLFIWVDAVVSRQTSIFVPRIEGRDEKIDT